MCASSCWLIVILFQNWSKLSYGHAHSIPFMPIPSYPSYNYYNVLCPPIHPYTCYSTIHPIHTAPDGPTITPQKSLCWGASSAKRWSWRLYPPNIQPKVNGTCQSWSSWLLSGIVALAISVWENVSLLSMFWRSKMGPVYKWSSCKHLHVFVQARHKRNATIL